MAIAIAIAIAIAMASSVYCKDKNFAFSTKKD
jgi:hypothetical protein